MKEELTAEWIDEDGRTIRIYEQSGLIPTLRWLVQPEREVDPGTFHGFVRQNPYIIRGFERIEIIQGDEVIIRG